MRSSTSTSDARARIKRALQVLAGFVLGLLLVELCLRMLPVSTATKLGYHVDERLLTYPPGHTWMVSTGWDLRNAHSFRANNFGFPDARDFVPGSGAVVLVGDSYVEASMLDETDRPGPQLEHLLGAERPVYAMGGPGSSLLDYAERVRFARKRLGATDFVVLLEAGDVRQALCGSGNVHSECLNRDTLAPTVVLMEQPSLLKQIGRSIALAQYFVGQIKVDLGQIARGLNQRTVPGESLDRQREGASSRPDAKQESLAFVDAVTEEFFRRVRPYATGRLVVVIDGQRDLSKPLGQGLRRERERFVSLARANGAIVVDTEEAFGEHWRRSRRPLVVGPYDGHMNPEAVKLAMQAAAQAIR